MAVSSELLTKSACTIVCNIAPYDSSVSTEEPQQQLCSQLHQSLQAATSLERQNAQKEGAAEKSEVERQGGKKVIPIYFLFIIVL